MVTKKLNGLKATVAVLTFATAMSLASNGYGQNQAPLFNGAGSSAAFNALGLAARVSNPGGTSGICGDHSWTKKSTAQGIDNRLHLLGATWLGRGTPDRCRSPASGC